MLPLNVGQGAAPRPVPVVQIDTTRSSPPSVPPLSLWSPILTCTIQVLPLTLAMVGVANDANIVCGYLDRADVSAAPVTALKIRRCCSACTTASSVPSLLTSATATPPKVPALA